MHDTQKAQENEYAKDKFEYLKYCYSKMDDLKTSIYQRASILVVVMSFIIVAWAYTMERILNISNEANTWKIILYIACFAFLITFFITICYGVRFLMPLKRNKYGKIEFIAGPAKSTQNTEIKEMVFTVFDYIYDSKKCDFEKIVQKLDLEQINGQLVSSIHGLSRIIERRYNYFRTACKWLLSNIAILVLLSILELIISIIC